MDEWQRVWIESVEDEQAAAEVDEFESVTVYGDVFGAHFCCEVAALDLDAICWLIDQPQAVC